MPPFSRFEVFSGQATDGDTDKAQSREAHGGAHPPHLPVPALIQNQFYPAIRDVCTETDGRVAEGDERGRVEEAGEGGPGAVVADGDAGGESAKGLGGDDAFDLRPVSTRMREAGVGEEVLEAAVVGEEEEAFAVEVEAAGGIDAGLGDEAL
jgi:hypothetical protein